MKTYLLGIFIAIIAIAVFGFFGPVLISSASSEACLLGFALVIITLPVLVFLIKLFIKGFKK